MRKYELTVVISGKSTPAKQKSVVEKVSKLVDSFKGKVEKVDEWGKVDLTYKIEGNETGIFVLFDIELNADDVKKLSDKLKVEEDIIRFLVLGKEKDEAE